MTDEVPDESGPICPACGYPGLVHDEEFRAKVHDFCGYWQDDENL